MHCEGGQWSVTVTQHCQPAYVVSGGGGGTAEVLHKVDPRHSIIPSAFKWKFHKF